MYSYWNFEAFSISDIRFMTLYALLFDWPSTINWYFPINLLEFKYLFLKIIPLFHSVIIRKAKKQEDITYKGNNMFTTVKPPYNITPSNINFHRTSVFSKYGFSPHEKQVTRFSYNTTFC